jgi:hypothetical protein
MGNVVWYIFVFGILMMIGIVVSEIWPFVIGSMIFVLVYLFYQGYSDKKGEVLSAKRKEEELQKQEEIAKRRKINHDKSRISVMISDFFRIKSIQVRGQSFDRFSEYLDTINPDLKSFAIELRDQKIGSQINDTLIGLKHNGKLVLEDLEFFHAIAEDDLGWNRQFYPNAKKIITDMNSIGFRMYNHERDIALSVEEIIRNAAPKDITLDEAKARHHKVKVDFLGEGTLLFIDIDELYRLILFFLNLDLNGNKEVKELIRIYKFFSKRNKDIFMIELLIASRSNPDQVTTLCSDYNLFRTSNVHYLNIFAGWFKKLGLANLEMRALKLYMHHFKNHEQEVSERYDRLQSGDVEKYQSYNRNEEYFCFQIDRSKVNWDAAEFETMFQIFDAEHLSTKLPLGITEEIISAGDTITLPGLTEFLIDFHRYGSTVHPTIELTEILDVNVEGARPYSAVHIHFDENHELLHHVGMIVTIDTTDLSANRISITRYVNNENLSKDEFREFVNKFINKKNAHIRNTLTELYNSIIEYG